MKVYVDANDFMEGLKKVSVVINKKEKTEVALVADEDNRLTLTAINLNGDQVLTVYVKACIVERGAVSIDMSDVKKLKTLTGSLEICADKMKNGAEGLSIRNQKSVRQFSVKAADLSLFCQSTHECVNLMSLKDTTFINLISKAKICVADSNYRYPSMSGIYLDGVKKRIVSSDMYRIFQGLISDKDIVFSSEFSTVIPFFVYNVLKSVIDKKSNDILKITAQCKHGKIYRVFFMGTDYIFSCKVLAAEEYPISVLDKNLALANDNYTIEIDKKEFVSYCKEYKGLNDDQPLKPVTFVNKKDNFYILNYDTTNIAIDLLSNCIVSNADKDFFGVFNSEFLIKCGEIFDNEKVIVQATNNWKKPWIFENEENSLKYVVLQIHTKTTMDDINNMFVNLKVV